MRYGNRKSDVCSDKERDEFLAKVNEFLQSMRMVKNIAWKNMRAFNWYGGFVRIYTGRTYEDPPRRARRKLLAFKNPDGTIEGENEEWIQKLEKEGGSQLWMKHYEPIIRIEYFDVFRVDDWKEETDYLLEKFNKK